MDLSRRETALAGGDHGNAIVPGNANSSLVWLMTLSDSMPQNRPPLSIKEKQALHEWIDGGADWTYETLDSSIYERSDRAISN